MIVARDMTHLPTHPPTTQRRGSGPARRRPSSCRRCRVRALPCVLVYILIGSHRLIHSRTQKITIRRRGRVGGPGGGSGGGGGGGPAAPPLRGVPQTQPQPSSSSSSSRSSSRSPSPIRMRRGVSFDVSLEQGISGWMGAHKRLTRARWFTNAEPLPHHADVRARRPRGGDLGLRWCRAHVSQSIMPVRLSGLGSDLSTCTTISH